MIDESVKPVRQKFWHPPLAKREPISNERPRMEQECIIERVDASPWTSNIVTAKKRDGGQHSFELIKNKIVSPPVLAHFDVKASTIVTCDASSVAIGACLSQIHQGEESPIAFASRTLTPAERRYTQHQNAKLYSLHVGLRTLEFLRIRPSFHAGDRSPGFKNSADSWRHRTPAVPSSSMGRPAVPVHVFSSVPTW